MIELVHVQVVLWTAYFKINPLTINKSSETQHSELWNRALKISRTSLLVILHKNPPDSFWDFQFYPKIQLYGQNTFCNMLTCRRGPGGNESILWDPILDPRIISYIPVLKVFFGVFYLSFCSNIDSKSQNQYFYLTSSKYSNK